MKYAKLVYAALSAATTALFGGVRPTSSFITDGGSGTVGANAVLWTSVYDNDSSWIGRHLYWKEPGQADWVGWSFEGIGSDPTNPNRAAEMYRRWDITLNKPGTWEFMLKGYDEVGWGNEAITSIYVTNGPTYPPASTLTRISLPRMAINASVSLNSTIIDPDSGSIGRHLYYKRPNSTTWEGYSFETIQRDPWQPEDPNRAAEQSRAWHIRLDTAGTWEFMLKGYDTDTGAGRWGNESIVSVNVTPPDVLMWYDIDHLRDIGHGDTPADAWWPLMTDGNSDGVPEWNENDPWSLRDRRSTTPKLMMRSDPSRPYSSEDPPTVWQHSYWLKGIGVNAVIIDWTNIRTPNDPAFYGAGHIGYYQRVLAGTRQILDTLLSIPASHRVQVVFAVTPYNPVQANGVNPALAAAQYLRDTYVTDPNTGLPQPHAQLFYRLNDGSNHGEKPLLLPLMYNYWSNIDGPGDAADQIASQGFNARFLNAYTSTARSETWDIGNRIEVIKGSTGVESWPYWNYIDGRLENDSLPQAETQFKAIARRASDGSLEHAALWYSNNGSDNRQYGITNAPDNEGKITLERMAKPFLGSAARPRVLVINRMNYARISYAYADEGNTLHNSAFIEPCDAYGFDYFYRTARLISSLTNIPIPTLQVLGTWRSGGRLYIHATGNPTEVRFNGGNWTMINAELENGSLNFWVNDPGGSGILAVRNAQHESVAASY